MKIVMVGTGYVGLVSGLCFAEFGFETLCVDKVESRLNTIAKGICPFYEPGLNDLLVKHLNSTKRFSLSNNLSESLKEANVVFITVGTPTKRLENEADLNAVYEVAKEISENIVNYCVVVTKSTVPVGTTRKIKEIISQRVSSNKFDIVSNPEFLCEGSAINDFKHPDRVVIGTENKKSENIMREIYSPLSLNETSIVLTSIESAEVIKYASNSFLATKISFINEVADLCEVVGANVLDVTKAMGLDKRIGEKFLHAGPGFGGSCLPKDVKAFSATAKKHNVDFSIIKAVNASNEVRPINIASKIKNRFNNKLDGIVIGILGLSFKPNTDDIRNSTSVIIANELHKSGGKIKCFDPYAMTYVKNILPNLDYCNSALDVCKGSRVLIIATEWNEFKSLDLNKIKELMNSPIIFDLRNIYNGKEVKDLGIEYHGIGK